MTQPGHKHEILPLFAPANHREISLFPTCSIIQTVCSAVALHSIFKVNEPELNTLILKIGVFFENFSFFLSKHCRQETGNVIEQVIDLMITVL